MWCQKLEDSFWAPSCPIFVWTPYKFLTSRHMRQKVIKWVDWQAKQIAPGQALPGHINRSSPALVSACYRTANTRSVPHRLSLFRLDTCILRCLRGVLSEPMCMELVAREGLSERENEKNVEICRHHLPPLLVTCRTKSFTRSSRSPRT